MYVHLIRAYHTPINILDLGLARHETLCRGSFVKVCREIINYKMPGEKIEKYTKDRKGRKKAILTSPQQLASPAQPPLPHAQSRQQSTARRSVGGSVQAGCRTVRLGGSVLSGLMKALFVHH